MSVSDLPKNDNEKKVEEQEEQDVELPVLEHKTGESIIREKIDEEGSDSLRIINRPWRVKGPAVFCVLLFTIGSNWASASLSPLKSTLKKELHINNARYGVIASANSLVNTVMPVIGGVAIDWFGPEMGSLLSSVAVLLGTLISGIGASKASFGTLVAGNVIMGLGSSTIETCQSKLYTHWFYGNHLGLVYGVDIAFGRVINTVAKATSVPIAEGTHWWGWSIWISAIMSACTLLINIIYVALERRLPAPARLVPTNDKTSRKFSLAALVSIPAAFWIITLTQLLQAGNVGAYGSITADIMTQTRGSTALVAGYTSSISQIIPIFVTPCVGALFDRFGRRMYYVSGTAALWVLVYSLMGFTDVHPLVPTILQSVALSFNAIPFIAAIPLLAPSQTYLGTAFGVWKAFNNAGSVIMDVSAGAIQDRTPTGRHTYDNVLYFLIALKGVDFFYGLVYDALDRRYFGGVLRMSEREREAREDEDANSGENLKGVALRRPVRMWTFVGLGIMGAMIVVAWVLYLFYAKGT
ncbi:MFS transporter [Mycena indigotica]|uniref:Lysosomal dipeptide transporter MFSD1 n=1 Tax=Mycena indigotica TaxID=2126181 RepID=A0A8H6S5C7_9AGAR|nr:MFS transporter [Mycena indigotica]KAF7293068.1 MFS transporter [Mycena indigotica]